ncbi:glycosyltransferase family 87 protein [Deminuibacter soli]|uniref:DUF2029 domain-containing protein n=1 Tax=Deminuibacter soli TaxID=2291815 RepID=A0A3E1NR80_9BACT|nr:glycosyltransferase family 87 protein [Deminuibacter soli]RFM30442.1 DUF2029 domain-containing protein [Deminuibacter soli]
MNLLLRNIRFSRTKQIAFPVLAWFVMAFVAVLAETLRGSIQNYYIFRDSFWHSTHFQNLYANYGLDIFHYGPSFACLIAPFAILPDWLGVTLWTLANAWLLYYALRRMPFERTTFLIILLFCAIEMMTASHNTQFNPMVAAWLVLAFVLIEEEKDIWGTLFIAAGLLTKIYGGVGLLFFLFSKHKIKFIGFFAGWMLLLFCLPMLISSPSFVIESYQQWIHALVIKNNKNISGAAVASAQDMCVMGIIRRLFHPEGFADWMVMAPAAVLLALPLLRFKQYAAFAYRASYLAVLLITVVIFSTASESATFVIAVAGVAIWYGLQDKPINKWQIALLLLVWVVTSLATTDLVPRILRKPIKTYSLKALPPFIVWLVLIAQLLFTQFTAKEKAPLKRSFKPIAQL